MAKTSQKKNSRTNARAFSCGENCFPLIEIQTALDYLVAIRNRAAASLQCVARAFGSEARSVWNRWFFRKKSIA
jgi:hypothetical protein